MLPTGVEFNMDTLLSKDLATQLLEAVRVARRALRVCPQLHLSQQGQTCSFSRKKGPYK